MSAAVGLDDAGTRAAGGGPALAVHRGDRRVPRVRAHGRRRRGSGSSCSTPRPPDTRCCCSTRLRATSARCSAPTPTCPAEVCAAARAPARPGVRAHPRRHARRVDPGARGRAATGRPAARRHRAIRLGHQRLPLRRGHRTSDTRARAAAERAHIDRVRNELSPRTWLVGWQPEPPVGAQRLRELTSAPTALGCALMATACSSACITPVARR